MSTAMTQPAQGPVLSLGDDGPLLVREGLTASDEVWLSPPSDVRDGDAALR
jgi:hypothetical protein